MNYKTALVQLPLVRESTGERVRTPEDVYRVCGDIGKLAQEAFTVLSLDVRNWLINRHLVSLGLADAKGVVLMPNFHSTQILRFTPVSSLLV